MNIYIITGAITNGNATRWIHREVEASNTEAAAAQCLPDGWEWRHGTAYDITDIIDKIKAQPVGDAVAIRKAEQAKQPKQGRLF